MEAVRRRKREMVDGLVAVHVKKYKETGAELAMGQARFTGPKTLEVSLMMEDRERFSASGVFAIPSWTMA
jgi:pyruvate/2-oxoglutarate dehydrogenase complex dihydrolipoamide dehydrogenase (E3) component